MDTLKEYSLPLISLPEGLTELNFELSNEFFEAMEQDEVLNADIKVHISVDHKNDVYYFHIIGQGVIDIPCDRCLDPMAHEVSFDEELVVKYGEEYDDSVDGVLVIPDTETRLDIAPVLCDLTLLTIPMRHIHTNGECNEEMTEILYEHTGAADYDDEDTDDELTND
ncbi:MAG: DUF177 domain-containing protein [Muribaculaceae bacterium]|nr:DUF177 domain-containing protein [Muribaculaceae bacterium]